MILKALNAGKGPHTHVVYIRPDGTGITSIDQEHAHRIDEEGNMEEVNEHVHEVTEMTLVKSKNEPKQKVEQRAFALFKAASERESKARKRMDESDGFYTGEKQWTKDAKDKLTSSERASHTINEIAPKVNVLSGFQRQNRTDYEFFPVEGGDARVADILGIVVKNVTEQNDFSYEETDVFEDGAIVGRGLFNTFTDFDTNLEGDIIVERFNWRDCFFGPHEKKDIKDLEYLCKAKWLSWSKVRSLWPKVAKNLVIRHGLIGTELDASPKELHGKATGNYNDPDASVEENSKADPLVANIAKKEFRIIETWIKEYERVTVIFNPKHDFFTNTLGWSSKDKKAVKTIPDLDSVPRKQHRMRIITTVGGILADDDFLSVGKQEFHIVPFYATKRGESWYGIVEVAKDPQRSINKLHSQLSDITNKMVAYGWWIDDGTFVNKTDEKNFKDTSSQAGFVVKVTSTDKPPVGVDGVKFPSELANTIVMEKDNLSSIMNVNPELVGQTGRAESGVAIDKKQRQSLMGNEFLFDNHSRAKKLLGKLIVAQIQDVYTPERIMRILENENLRKPFDMGGQPFGEAMGEDAENPEEAEMNRQAIMSLLENADLTKYDVVVSESVNTPTKRYSTFLEWRELAVAGISVPLDFLVGLSDIADKEKVIASIQAQQQQEQQQEKAKIDAEIQKTQIAHAPQQGEVQGG